MSVAGCQLEEAFLLKVLRDVVNQHILQKEEVEDDLERHLEALWDLSMEQQAAEIIQQFQGLKIFAEAAERLNFEGHLSEVLLGILANVCSHWRPGENPQLDDVDLASTALKALESSDGLVAVQGLRISCSLLCAQVSVSQLWSSGAVDRYLFALENSLRWDVVRYACDALCQGLLLEITEDSESKQCSFAPRLMPQLPPLLEQRCQELCESEDDDLAEGQDLETALWSALRLAESLACLHCDADAQAALHASALMAIERAQKPEVLAAALEVLSTLQAQSKVDEACQAVVSLVASPEVLEKLLLLLPDLDDQDAALTAWVLLQQAEHLELRKHLEVLESACEAMSDELRGQLSPEFLHFLDKVRGR